MRLEGKTVAEIAEAVGSTVPAVRAYFNRKAAMVPVVEGVASPQPDAEKPLDKKPEGPAESCSIERPPVGVSLKWVWDAKRVDELAGAIGRYLAARMTVPSVWVEEYNDLLEKGLCKDDSRAENRARIF